MTGFFIVLGLVVVIYIFVVRPKIKQYRAISGVIDKVDAAGYSAWRTGLARLSGLKTVILASAAAMIPQFPPVLDELRGFTQWNVFLEQASADRIAAILAALTAVTHVIGLVSAAKAVPVTAEWDVNLPDRDHGIVPPFSKD